MLRLVDDKHWIIKKAKGLCRVSSCSNKSYKHRTLCCKHVRQQTKENNPIGYWFDVLRQNAKRRRIPFTLTQEHFRKFCAETKYLELKGRGSGKASIDRQKTHLGYADGNIQILEFATNSRKKFIDDKIASRYDDGIPLTQAEKDEFKNAINDYEMNKGAVIWDGENIF